MTVNQLAECLIQEIEDLSGKIGLTGINGEPRRLKGYWEALPPISIQEDWAEGAPDALGDIDPEDPLIPYFIVKTTEISYTDETAKARLYVLFCVHDNSGSGYQTIWNLLNRITGRFLTDTALDAFYCDKDIKVVIPDEDTQPYFFAGIEMVWNLPVLEMEV